MEPSPEMIEMAQSLAARLEAEIAAITAEYNDLIRAAGERAGVALSTEVEIKIIKGAGAE
jgi:hypothetical protein